LTARWARQRASSETSADRSREIATKCAADGSAQGGGTTASAQDVRRARFERGVLKSRSPGPEGQPIAFQRFYSLPIQKWVVKSFPHMGNIWHCYAVACKLLPDLSYPLAENAFAKSL
jgi:hypothetical protein